MEQQDLVTLLRKMPTRILIAVARRPEAQKNPALFLALKQIAFERGQEGF